VAAARGARILFTDADCRPAPGWVERLAAALDRSPVAGGAVAFRLDADRWALADNIASFHELLADRPAESDTDAPLGSLNLAVSRQAWQRIGPFDEALTTSEDFDWVLRARAAGVATAFVPQAVVEHADVRDRRGCRRPPSSAATRSSPPSVAARCRVWSPSSAPGTAPCSTPGRGPSRTAPGSHEPRSAMSTDPP
jgi:GT2 family glycosyltransferase